MKRAIVVLISIVLLIIDNSVAPFFSVMGAFPSLLFTFAVAYSLINGKEDAVFIGAVSGILQDIFFSNGIGINALTNMIICLLCAYIGNGIFKKKKIVPIVTIFGMTILKHVSVFIILYLLNYHSNLYNVIYVALYNSLVMFIGYRFVLEFSNMDDVKDKWRIR